MCRIRAARIVFVVVGVLLPSSLFAEQQIHGLLVGCARYPNQPDRMQLTGPANDVVLVRETLQRLFRIPANQLAVLSSGEDPESQPTFGNIERELARLLKAVQPGDQVVIFLSGHGSQQPDDPNDPDENDGLDEIFLPSDIGAWDGKKGAVQNALTDDRIREWIGKFVEKEAFVFFIADSCHSGTLARGGSGEVARNVPADKLVPESALDAARSRAEKQSDPRSRPSGYEMPKPSATSPRGGWIALYAALPTEQAIEQKLPPETEKTQYGRLTYTFCEVLSRTNHPLSYRELSQRIVWQFQKNWSGQSPQLEGTDVDRVVLGNDRWEGRSAITLSQSSDKTWRVNAGAFQRMTRGSVLAVYAPDAASGAAPVGHVRLDVVRATDATVIPVAYDKHPLIVSLPDKGRCEVVLHDLGEMKLRVRADVSELEHHPELAGRLRSALTNVGARKDSLIQIVPDNAVCDWLVVGTPQEVSWKKVVMSDNASSASVVKTPWDGPLEEWLAGTSRGIARAANLLKLADFQSAEGSAVKIEVTLEREVRSTENGTVTWEPFPGKGPAQVRDFDKLRMQIHNRGQSSVDVSVLYIDSVFGIKSFFPKENEVGTNRIPAEKSLLRTLSITIDDKTFGPEHLVVLAVQSNPQDPVPLNFGFLAQPSLSQARSAEKEARTRGNAKGSAFESALGKQLTRAMFADGAGQGARALRPSEEATAAIHRTSWEVVRDTSPLATTPLSAQATRIPSLSQTASSTEWTPKATSERPKGPALQAYPKVAPAVVVIRTDHGHGTGFFFTPDGWILTNHHVVEDSHIDQKSLVRTVKVHIGELKDGWMRLRETPLTGIVYQTSAAKDLALVKLEQLPEGWKAVPFIPFAESPAKPGVDCVAIGHPSAGTLWTVRGGEVAGLGIWPRDQIDILLRLLAVGKTEQEDFESQLQQIPPKKVLLSTCGLNPGDSGGPLVNANGELIAVSFAVPGINPARGVDLGKFSFHVDLSEVKEFTAKLPTMPEVAPPDPIPAGDLVEAQDFDRNKQRETFIFGTESDKRPTGILVDLDEDSVFPDKPTSTPGKTSGTKYRGFFDFEFAVQFRPRLRFFYDTDNDGELDLIFSDEDDDGSAEMEFRRVGTEWRVTKREKSRSFDADHFQDKKLRERFLSLPLKFP